MIRGRGMMAALATGIAAIEPEPEPAVLLRGDARARLPRRGARVPWRIRSRTYRGRDGIKRLQENERRRRQMEAGVLRVESRGVPS